MPYLERWHKGHLSDQEIRDQLRTAQLRCATIEPFWHDGANLYYDLDGLIRCNAGCQMGQDAAYMIRRQFKDAVGCKCPMCMEILRAIPQVLDFIEAFGSEGQKACVREIKADYAEINWEE